MHSLIVTAGHGDVHAGYAKRVMRHVNNMVAQMPRESHAIPCLDLSDKMPWSEMRKPHHCKFHIWQCVPDSIDRLIWIDTDTFMRRALTEDEFPDHPFCAVVDYWQRVGADGHRRKMLTRDRVVFQHYPRYFNAGFMVCTRAAIPAFKHAFERRDTMFRHRRGMSTAADPLFWDQDHFKYAVWQLFGKTTSDGAGWYQLDAKYNAQRPLKPTDDAVILHFCGGAKNHKEFEECYKGVAK